MDAPPSMGSSTIMSAASSQLNQRLQLPSSGENPDNIDPEKVEESKEPAEISEKETVANNEGPTDSKEPAEKLEEEPQDEESEKKKKKNKFKADTVIKRLKETRSLLDELLLIASINSHDPNQLHETQPQRDREDQSCTTAPDDVEKSNEFEEENDEDEANDDDDREPKLDEDNELDALTTSRPKALPIYEHKKVVGAKSSNKRETQRSNVNKTVERAKQMDQKLQLADSAPTDLEREGDQKMLVDEGAVEETEQRDEDGEGDLQELAHEDNTDETVRVDESNINEHDGGDDAFKLAKQSISAGKKIKKSVGGKAGRRHTPTTLVTTTHVAARSINVNDFKKSTELGEQLDRNIQLEADPIVENDQELARENPNEGQEENEMDEPKAEDDDDDDIDPEPKLDEDNTRSKDVAKKRVDGKSGRKRQTTTSNHNNFNTTAQQWQRGSEMQSDLEKTSDESVLVEAEQEQKSNESNLQDESQELGCDEEDETPEDYEMSPKENDESDRRVTKTTKSRNKASSNHSTKQAQVNKVMVSTQKFQKRIVNDSNKSSDEQKNEDGVGDGDDADEEDKNEDGDGDGDDADEEDESFLSNLGDLDTMGNGIMQNLGVNLFKWGSEVERLVKKNTELIFKLQKKITEREKIRASTRKKNANKGQPCAELPVVGDEERNPQKRSDDRERHDLTQFQQGKAERQAMSSSALDAVTESGVFEQQEMVINDDDVTKDQPEYENIPGLDESQVLRSMEENLPINYESLVNENDGRKTTKVGKHDLNLRSTKTQPKQQTKGKTATTSSGPSGALKGQVMMKLDGEDISQLTNLQDNPYKDEEDIDEFEELETVNDEYAEDEYQNSAAESKQEQSEMSEVNYDKRTRAVLRNVKTGNRDFNKGPMKSSILKVAMESGEYGEEQQMVLDDTLEATATEESDEVMRFVDEKSLVKCERLLKGNDERKRQSLPKNIKRSQLQQAKAEASPIKSAITGVFGEQHEMVIGDESEQDMIVDDGILTQPNTQLKQPLHKRNKAAGRRDTITSKRRATEFGDEKLLSDSAQLEADEADVAAAEEEDEEVENEEKNEEEEEENEEENEEEKTAITGEVSQSSV